MAEVKGLMYAQVKSRTEDEGSFDGVLSTYGNVDLVGDVVEAGAFDEDISRSGPHRVLLWQHDSAEPIGSFDVTSTSEELTISGSFNLDTQRGREAHSLLKRGDINGLSIGYIATDYNFDAQGLRHLTKVQLLEGSLVTFPANTLARASAKYAEDMTSSQPDVPQNPEVPNAESEQAAPQTDENKPASEAENLPDAETILVIDLLSDIEGKIEME